MKQSKMTGKYIFDQMQKLEKEILELERALESIEDDFSKVHIAYKLLDQQYKDKRAEFQQLERKEYTEVVTPTIDFSVDGLLARGN
jgi:septal ring factor EnvC (AmiA/AmiB activator)